MQTLEKRVEIKLENTYPNGQSTFLILEEGSTVAAFTIEKWANYEEGKTIWIDNIHKLNSSSKVNCLKLMLNFLRIFTKENYTRVSCLPLPRLRKVIQRFGFQIEKEDGEDIYYYKELKW